MKEYKKATKKLEKYNQKHLIPLFDYLTEEEKTILIEQINSLDFKRIYKLYSELSKKSKIDSEGIEELKALNKDKLAEKELKNYDSIGENIIRNNQYALVTMSGGQGTRLGYNGAKGTFKVDISPKPKFLFEILADKLKEINEKYNVIIPWYIMTSEENNAEIESFFKEHKYFDYPESSIMFFKQGKLPLITENGNLILNENKVIKEAADGNGGIFNSMYKNGIIKDMQKRGIKWIFIGSIDNILLKLAKNEKFTFKKEELPGLLTDNEKNIISDFLDKMTKINILQCTDEELGEYEFVNIVYFVYFLISSSFNELL